MPGPFLGPRARAMNKANKVPALKEFTVSSKKAGNNRVSKQVNFR